MRFETPFDAGQWHHTDPSEEALIADAQWHQALAERVLMSEELDRQIAHERQALALSNMRAKLDRCDRDIEAIKKARRVEMTNEPDAVQSYGADLRDPRNLPGARQRMHGDQQRGARKYHENLDAASFSTRGSGAVMAGDMSNPNLPGAPKHSDGDEMMSHAYNDGQSNAAGFLAMIAVTGQDPTGRKYR